MVVALDLEAAEVGHLDPVAVAQAGVADGADERQVVLEALDALLEQLNLVLVVGFDRIYH